MERQLSEYRVTYLNGLGLVATGRRAINRGNQFDSYYPNRELKEVELGVGNSYFTLDNMVERLKRDYKEAQKIATLLYSPDLNTFCRNIFNHIYKNFQYKPDPISHEQIKGVAGSYKLRLEGIDCDDMAFLAGCILYTKGVPFAFRKIAQASTGDFSHVYVVVPKQPNLSLSNRNNYYVIDPVLDRYDYEYPENYLPKYYDEVKVTRQMNGLNGLFGMNGLENYKLNTKQGWEQLRAAILDNKESVPAPYAIDDFIAKVSGLISYWEYPQLREYTIEQLHEAETLRGLSGLDGFFKNAVKAVGSTVKKVATSKPAQIVAKVVSAPVKLATAPLRLAAREGIKLWFRKLGKKKAKSLWVGIYTEDQAKAKGINLADWKRRKDNWEKVKKIFEGLDGDDKNLAEAIHDGAAEEAKSKAWFLPFATVWNKQPIISANTVKGVNGLGEVATATATTAAATFIAAILKILDGTSDDPKIEALSSLVDSSKALVNTASAKNEPMTTLAPAEKQSAAIVDDNIIVADVEEVPNPDDPSPGGTFFQANKTAIIVGGALLAAGIGTYFAINHKKGKKMNGVPTKEPKPTRKKVSKRPTKRKTVKTISI